MTLFRGGHGVERGHHLELARGFAGEVKDAFEAPGAELAQREFDEGAGFSEAGGGFEQDDRVAGECAGEIGLGGFLAGAQRGERGAEAQVAEALTGTEAEVEKFADPLQLGLKEGVVRARQDDGLREPAGDFHEVQFGAKSSGGHEGSRRRAGQSVT